MVVMWGVQSITLEMRIQAVMEGRAMVPGARDSPLLHKFHNRGDIREDMRQEGTRDFERRGFFHNVEEDRVSLCI
jgi:hypothetical protein